MRNLVIILDPAHGIDVAGKCPPDNSFKEWKYSRAILNQLKPRLEAEGFRVEFTNTTNKEIGLSARARFATNLEVAEGQTKFLFSLHNNASGNGTKWGTARGFEIYSYKNPFSISYKMAEYIIRDLGHYFPEYKMRVFGPKNLVKQQNYTVLMGAGYHAALLEWMFMDTKEDLKILKDSTVNEKLIDALVTIFKDLDEDLPKLLSK